MSWKLSQLTFPSLPHPSYLELLRTTSTLSLEAYKLKLDNLIQISEKSPQQFRNNFCSCCSVGHSDHQRHSNLNPGKSIRLPSLTASEDALSQTSRNLGWLPSEFKRWDFNLLQLILFFHRNTSYEVSNCLNHRPNFMSSPALLPPAIRHYFDCFQD